MTQTYKCYERSNFQPQKDYKSNLILVKGKINTLKRALDKNQKALKGWRRAES